MQYAQVGNNLADNGRKDDAKKMLEKCDKMMLQENFPYGMISRGNDHNQLSLAVMQAAYYAEDKPLAEKIANSVKKDLQQQIKYYNSLSGWQASGLNYEKQAAQDMLDRLAQVQQVLGGNPVSPEGNTGALKIPADSAQPTDTPK